MNFPKELRYTQTHEWVSPEGQTAKVGISDYAQKEISDVVFVELPKVGDEVLKGKPAAVVESVKAAFDIYVPLSGKVTKVNDALASNPGLVNQDAYGDGWFFEVEMQDNTELEKLMDSEAYESHIQAESKS